MTNTQLTWYWLILTPILYGAIFFTAVHIARGLDDLGFYPPDWLVNPPRWIEKTIVYSPLLSVVGILCYICYK